MSKPKKLYMKTPDARNPHGLTCESILRRLEVDAMNGKKITIERLGQFITPMPPDCLGHSASETTTGHRHPTQPVFYSDDGHILMGPYYYTRTKPTDDGRISFAGAQDLWGNGFSNSAMTLKLYSWDGLIDDYNKNNQQLTVRFKTQAHNSKDPADYTDRLWDLNSLYIVRNWLPGMVADKQLELCGYGWKAR